MKNQYKANLNEDIKTLKEMAETHKTADECGVARGHLGILIEHWLDELLEIKEKG